MRVRRPDCLHAKALEMALGKLRTAGAVIIDASYKDREERSRAFEAGRRAGADVVVLECVCPEDIIEKRLQSRLSGGGDVSDGRWEIFQAQKGSFERIEEIPEGSHLVVDTSLAPEENAFRFLKKLSGGG